MPTEYLDYFTRLNDHELKMVFTRQKSRAGENPDSSPRNNPETNIREICTTSHTVFIHKYNELFIEQVIQCSHLYQKRNRVIYHKKRQLSYTLLLVHLSYSINKVITINLFCHPWHQH